MSDIWITFLQEDGCESYFLGAFGTREEAEKNVSTNLEEYGIEHKIDSFSDETRFNSEAEQVGMVRKIEMGKRTLFSV